MYSARELLSSVRLGDAETAARLKGRSPFVPELQTRTLPRRSRSRKHVTSDPEAELTDGFKMHERGIA